ncbi:hypothetical protein MtrunA17_Chr4g0051401 [Medicago truncatula]|uniref:Uncharacterized protein n=1 Tax=Medicago truncatula TaxID=3880 RepID=A0A396IIR9_MEDTR|nr:hypothetical protein MtrunA17_Chr4g0051401 [Medicago truncatula]
MKKIRKREKILESVIMTRGFGVRHCRKFSSCLVVSIAEYVNEKKTAISTIIKYDLRGIIFCWLCYAYAARKLIYKIISL